MNAVFFQTSATIVIVMVVKSPEERKIQSVVSSLFPLATEPSCEVAAALLNIDLIVCSCDKHMHHTQ